MSIITKKLYVNRHTIIHLLDISFSIQNLIVIMFFKSTSSLLSFGFSTWKFTSTLTFEHIYFIPPKLHIFSFFYTIITLERDLLCGMWGQTKNFANSRKNKINCVILFMMLMIDLKGIYTSFVELIKTLLSYLLISKIKIQTFSYRRSHNWLFVLNCYFYEDCNGSNI